MGQAALTDGKLQVQGLKQILLLTGCEMVMIFLIQS